MGRLARVLGKTIECLGTIEKNLYLIRINFELAARLSFQFALPAMEASKIRQLIKIEVRNCPIIVNLRQVIASNRGKELVQVTLAAAAAAIKEYRLTPPLRRS